MGSPTDEDFRICLSVLNPRLPAASANHLSAAPEILTCSVVHLQSRPCLVFFPLQNLSEASTCHFVPEIWSKWAFLLKVLDFFTVTENGKQERHLVATVGKFSIVWNFQQVKNSKHECYRNQEGMKSCYCYKIVLKDESIVDSCFMHEKFAVNDSPEAPLVVATPMKVTSFSISNQQ